jgi:hypothetical protein
MIEVAYTPAEGIVVRGTERAQAPALKKTRDRMKWYGQGGFWYVPRTRDTVQPRWRVDRLAEDLRRELPGVEVVVNYDLGEGVRPAEEREVDRKERAEERADRLEERAEKKAGEAAAAWEAGRATADGIPLGQPILVGHHSERRHRRDIEKIQRSSEKSAELREEAADAKRGAVSARATVAAAEDPGAMQRRIERLEADRRRIERELAGESELVALRVLTDELSPDSLEFSLKYACPDGPTCADPACTNENARRAGIAQARPAEESRLKSTVVFRFPGAQRRAELEARRAAIVDEVGHLRSKLGGALPGPADFKKGDLVAGPHGTVRVERVNPKSLSVVPLQPMWPGQRYTIPYDRRPRLLGAPTPEQKAKEEQKP